MTALELRLIAYGLAALLLLGGAGWLGYHFTAAHYERVIASDKAAQSVALQDAQQRVIAAQAAQAQATQQAEQKYADLKTSYDALSNDLAHSLQQYAQIHSGIVSATAGTAALADAARESASRTEELARLSGLAAQACLDDSASLTGLQIWAAALK